jgi:hypothetical protein
MHDCDIRRGKLSCPLIYPISALETRLRKDKGVVMGQAVADLPDPLESANPSDAKSADDLLSQMAGDEIDRLLAESDGEAPPVERRAIAPEAAAKAASETPAPAAPVNAPAAALVQAVDLDAVLDTAIADHHAAAEKSALHATAPAPVAAKPVDRSPQIELGEGARRVPLVLRPLEWLSSPLDPWPDQIREILGKVGLMTLINALAVLAYVLIFRRHHH